MKVGALQLLVNVTLLSACSDAIATEECRALFANAVMREIMAAEVQH